MVPLLSWFLVNEGKSVVGIYCDWQDGVLYNSFQGCCLQVLKYLEFFLFVSILDLVEMYAYGLVSFL